MMQGKPGAPRDLPKILRYVQAAHELVVICGTVPTSSRRGLMRAVVFVEPGRVEVADLPDFVLRGPTDAVVRVTRAAICGSDLHFLHGKTPTSSGAGLGHEAVGVVEAVGDEVTGVRNGDRVRSLVRGRLRTMLVLLPGPDPALRMGGRVRRRALRGRSAGDPGRARPRPMGRRQPAAGTRCRRRRSGRVRGDATTGFHAAARAEVPAEELVAVVGAGPVGWCAAASLLALGSARVVVLDREPARLGLAAGLGAMTVHVGERSAETALAEMTGDRGPDVVIEAVGTVEAYRTATTIVRRGGRVVIAGVFAGEPVELQLGVAWARALDLRSRGSARCTHTGGR